MNRLLSCGFLLLMAISGYSQIWRNLTDFEHVGTADLIVLGHIVTLDNPGTDIGKATIAVKEILRGKPIERLTLSNLSWMPPAVISNKMFLNQERVFFLQHIRDGYTLTNGSSSILPEERAADIRQLIKDFPVEVSLVSPDTVCYFNRITLMTVTVKNTSDHPISISQIDLQGYFLSPEMKLNLDNVVQHPMDGPHTGTNISTIIQPHETYTAKLKFFFAQPKSLDGLQPINPFLPYPEYKTDIAVRGRVIVDTTIPRKSIADTYCVVSPLIQALVGFPPPPEHKW